MKMPASAPSTPDVNDPSWLITWPCRSSVAVCSPKYHTVPARVWAYQSQVRSVEAAVAEAPVEHDSAGDAVDDLGAVRRDQHVATDARGPLSPR